MKAIIKANPYFPAVTALDVGRDLYHRRHDVMQIIGDRNSLSKIAWILDRVTDMFDVQSHSNSLIVRRAKA